MTTRQFRFTFSVSDEFLRSSPDAERWIDVQKEIVQAERWAEGPHGGLYRLDDEPLQWETLKGTYDWIRGETRYLTTRTGRYVRPSRVPIEARVGVERAFKTFVLPVLEGGVTLPSGKYVGTPTRFVSVPISTRSNGVPIPRRT